MDKRLIEIGDLAIKITPIDFGYSDGLRTAEQQNLNYLKGASRLDGYNRISKHQTGLALDFYAYLNGKASFEPEHLAIVAAAHLQAASQLGYKLKSGMFFKRFKRHLGKDYLSGWDYPHIELTE